MRVLLYLVLCVVFVGGCASSQNRGGSASWLAAAVAGDGPGRKAPTATPEPLTVKNLPKSRRGNPSDYTVDGVRYAVMDSAEGYSGKGKASWYGKKFHGRETSSGELYDMYQLTAAHKHLPLPTFVRVTRLDSGHSIIVKVNDRGPFVSGREIDLSYQAAASLGIVEHGTAEVLVEALSSHKPVATTVAATSVSKRQTGAESPIIEVSASASASASAQANYLQLGAFSNESNAERLAIGLGGSLPVPIVIDHNLTQSLFRVWVGPINSIAEQEQAVAALRSQGVSQFSMVSSTY